MSDRTWTFERVAAERPELAHLARLHGTLEEAATRTAAVLPAGALHPLFPGTPARQWLQGRALLEAADQGALAGPVACVFRALAEAVRASCPPAAEACTEVLAATGAADFPWAERLASFRDAPPPEAVPRPDLYRFLLLRAISVPAAHLPGAYSPPPPGRWHRAACPFCGVPPAAAIARAGVGRTLLCVLCGGRWERADLACPACGEERPDRVLVLGAREAGPASFESCATCRSALKVFAEAVVGPGPPIAAEVATALIDVAAESGHGVRRDEVARAALFPPP